MRKSWLSVILAMILIGVPAVTFAHSEGGKPADAPTLVRQSIDYLEGIHDYNQAKERAQLSLYAAGNDKLNRNDVVQALAAIEKKDAAKAEQLMAESLKNTPNGNYVLPLEPKFQPTAFNVVWLIISAVLIALGAGVIYKVKPKSLKRPSSTHYEA